jgi:hypothetical protein
MFNLKSIVRFASISFFAFALMSVQAKKEYIYVDPQTSAIEWKVAPDGKSYQVIVDGVAVPGWTFASTKSDSEKAKAEVKAKLASLGNMLKAYAVKVKSDSARKPELMKIFEDGSAKIVKESSLSKAEKAALAKVRAGLPLMDYDAAEKTLNLYEEKMAALRKSLDSWESGLDQFALGVKNYGKQVDEIKAEVAKEVQMYDEIQKKMAELQAMRAKYKAENEAWHKANDKPKAPLVEEPVNPVPAPSSGAQHE